MSFALRILGRALCFLAASRLLVKSHLIKPDGKYTGVEAPQLQARDTALTWRLLPLGDSITWGKGSSDGNGYRLKLENLIKGAGVTVDFIGYNSNGDNNPDNQNEGFPLYHCSAIQDQMQHNDHILREQPNLVLMHAGTNDNLYEKGEPYAEAPTRLGNLIDYVLCECPDTILLVAKVIQMNANQSQTDYFNSKVRGVVATRRNKGYKIHMVDMSEIGGNLLDDGLHPNDAGYEVMARTWWAGIVDLPSNWYSPPSEVSAEGIVPLETCDQDSTYWTVALDNKDSIFEGAHVSGDPGEPASSDDNSEVWVPQWDDQGLILIGVSREGGGVVYADLDGNGLDDYLWVNYTTGDMSAWLNHGSNAYAPVFDGYAIRWGTGHGSGVQLADLSGDGKADYIVLMDDGTMRVWKNLGPAGDVWSWTELDDVNNNFAPPGVTTTTVFFGDLNGDGKADMAVAHDDGTISFHLAQGDIGTSSFSWQNCPDSALWTSNPHPRLADIDGDGKDDFLSIDGDGGIKGWLNGYHGGCNFGWRAVSDGIEKGVALMTAPNGAEQVRLADIDGDGKVDYLIVGDDTGSISAQLNVGYMTYDEPALGGYAAAVRWGDLDGDGKDDYFSVDENGDALVYLNGGKSGDTWIWTEQAKGGLTKSGSGASRHQVQLADLNGDGLSDYLIIDDKNGGVTCWLNGGPNEAGWSWISKGLILIGVGRDGGVGVRFADMNGDGRADYIYLDENGAATVWINKGEGSDVGFFEAMNNGYPAAIGVGAKRQDVRFADIDGDGLADYIWIHPEDKTVEVYYNGGPLGDALGWVHGGIRGYGLGYPARNTEFARIGTTGRADLVALEESTGAVQAWLSICGKVIGTKSGEPNANLGTCGKPPLDIPTVPDNNGWIYEFEPSILCNVRQQYANLDDLNAVAGNMREDCLAIHTMQVLSSMLTTAYDNYTDVNDGYDELFTYYVTYMKKLVPLVLAENFMFNSSLLTSTETFPPIGYALKYFDCVGGEDGKNHFPCTDLAQTSNQQDASEYGVTFTLIDSDGYNKALVDAGIDPDWTAFGDYEYDIDYVQPHASRKFVYKFHNFPVESSSMAVPNPKDIVTKALPSIPSLQDDIDATYYEAMLGIWTGGSLSDGPAAYGIPVFVFMQAIESMAEAKKLGKTEEKEEEAEKKRKRNFILLIISAVLLFVPVIGEEVAAAVGLSTLARTIAIAGELGNAAVDIYDTVQDPSSAVVNILGLLLGVGGIAKTIREGEDIAKVAKLSRGMSPDQAAKLGKVFKANNDKLTSILNVCKLQ